MAGVFLCIAGTSTAFYFYLLCYHPVDATNGDAIYEVRRAMGRVGVRCLP